jgi:tRNA(fMet)-specific endonuclease VapC
LVDTNVVSYLVRRDTRAELYRPYLEGKEIAISFMTVAELRHWGLVHDWGATRRAALAGELRQYTVYYADDALCSAWAEIITAGERQGRPIATSDAWVAAPAWLAGIPLVTHNRRHFAGIAGLDVVSFAPEQPGSA